MHLMGRGDKSVSPPSGKKVTPGFRPILVSEEAFDRLKKLQRLAYGQANDPNGVRFDLKDVASAVVLEALLIDGFPGTGHGPRRADRSRFLPPPLQGERSMKLVTATLSRMSQAKAAIDRKTTAWYVGGVVGLTGMANNALAINLDMNNVGAATGLGPVSTAIQQFADMNTGLKALVIIIGFLVALIGLAALRNFAPVLGYVGLAIFAAVGLTVAFAIAGAVI
jgi:hypothetical protein